MLEQKKSHRIDTKEFELPDTHYIRAIEDGVFKEIVLQCLSRIDGVGVAEATIIDSLLGRDQSSSVKGISIQQDNQNHSVSIKVELNVKYGIVIPSKAEEIQGKIVEEVTRLTGLHVSCVNIVFKEILRPAQVKKEVQHSPHNGHEMELPARYSDDF